MNSWPFDAFPKDPEDVHAMFLKLILKVIYFEIFWIVLGRYIRNAAFDLLRKLCALLWRMFLRLPPVRMFRTMVYRAWSAIASRFRLWILQYAFRGINSTTADGYTPLMLACRDTSSREVKFLLERGANVNAHNTKDGGWTALLLALARTGEDSACFSMVRMLVDHGANVNAADREGRTALMYTFDQDVESVDILQLLLANGANVNAALENGRTALMLLLLHDTLTMNVSNHHRMLYLLLQRGANVNAVAHPSGDTPLLCALRRYKQGVVLDDVAIDGPPPYPKRGIRLGPLHYSDHRFMVERLLQYGADVNNTNEVTGTTPLMVALGRMRDGSDGPEATDEHCLMIQLLLHYGANAPAVDPRNGLTALMVATFSNHSSEVIRMILDIPGVDVNAIMEPGLSSLYNSVHWNNLEIVTTLLERGANPNDVDLVDDPLLYSILEQNEPVATALVRAGAAILQGHNPVLPVAAGFSLPGTIAAILERDGADVHVRDHFGDSALDRCISPHANQVCTRSTALLLQHGADANATNRHGTTPLMEAIVMDLSQILDVFLQHKVDVNVPAGETNLTPLQVATQQGKAHFVRQLLEYGADWRPCFQDRRLLARRHKRATETEFINYFVREGARYCAVRNALRRSSLPGGSEFLIEFMRGLSPLVVSEEEYQEMKNKLRRMQRSTWCPCLIRGKPNDYQVET